jgi:DNA-binding PadR family transcriptional regulator
VQIYPSLIELEQAGLITGRADPRGKRPRRIYQITEPGEAVLREWLGRRAPMPFELRDIGMVKLFFADALDRPAAQALLEAVRQRSQERLATLREIQPAADTAEADGNLYPLLTLRMGIAFHQAMIDVCLDFEHRVLAEELSDHAGGIQRGGGWVPAEEPLDRQPGR